MLKYILFVNLILLFSIVQGQINHEEFATRRSKLMSTLENGIVILKGAQEIQRNNDVEYPFRQYSNFYYLTGFDEEDASMILLPHEKKFIMFVKAFDPKNALWLGENYGLENTKNIFKADTVIVADSFHVSLEKYLKNRKKIFLLEEDKELTQQVNQIVSSDTLRYPGKIENLENYLANLRLIKSAYEIEMLQKSINITTEALHSVFKILKPGKYEYELNAEIMYTYLKNNSPRVGFPSIVASGPNATILHYRNYNRQVKNGDLVLFDIGAEYGMYSADITRTVPANGKFSKKQKEIYQIVLDAQKAAMNLCKPGTGTKEISAASISVIKDGLYKLGLITNKESHWQTHVWFMHGISHWLGLDTHDAGGHDYGSEKGKILQPGMLLTIEPGIYISQLAFDSFPGLFGRMVSSEEIEAFSKAVKPAFEKYKNIGVRIEDDILITDDSNKILSENAVREITDIEKMMAD